MPKCETHSALLAGSDIQREIDLEDEYRAEGVAVYNLMRRRSESKGDAAMLKPGERMLMHWFGPLETAISISRASMLATGYGKGAGIISAPLQLIQPDMLAVLAIRETLGLFFLDSASRNGVKLTRACYAVGRAVMAEINYDAINKTQPGVAWILTERVQRLDPCKLQWWARKSLDDPMTERRVAIAMGAWLIELLMQTAHVGIVGESEMAFDVTMRRQGKHRCRWLRMHSQVFGLIEDGHYMRQILRPRFGPMIVRPYPWDHEYEGGYAKLRTPLISKLTREQREQMRIKGNADLAYEALNVLGSVPFEINPRILPVAQEVWARGGDRLSMPRKDPAPLPPFPRGYDADAERPADRWASVSADDKAAWKMAARQSWRDNRETAGQRTECVGILDTAQRFAGEELYFPHQFDFRGRSYPIPVHLNHQGNDLCRGLLSFGNAVDIGDDGLYWLMVHAANCYGVDKIPYEARVEWVKQHARDIAKAVSDPVSDEFWQSADKPWQFLAACYALDDDKDAKQLPVQFDGTANGLQHYSAMTRDPVGGNVVNLIPKDEPDALYWEACERVASLIKLDRISGVAVPRDVEQYVTKDVVKQPVMTTTYGVTGYGARGQIRGKLKEAGVPDEQARAIAKYLAEKIAVGIEGMCPGARSAMDWLKDCAIRISKSGRPISWTSPIGMPVIQPYKDGRKGHTQIETALGRIRIASDDSPPASRKHVQGFAPNFVHSVDASHLMSTALAFSDLNMDFAGVHDSYWMHAGNAGAGYGIIREQFVLLHENDILGDLERELKLRHPTVDIQPRPAYGDLDIRGVLQSRYFFH